MIAKEYKSIFEMYPAETEKVDKQLNQLAAGGWQILHVVPLRFADCSPVFIILQRPSGRSSEAVWGGTTALVKASAKPGT